MAPELTEALNAHLTAEYRTAYLYLQMGTWLLENDCQSMGRWFEAQARRELGHAEKVRSHLLARGCHACFGAISLDRSEWRDMADVLQESYRQELEVSRIVHAARAMALECDDRPAETLTRRFACACDEDHDCEKYLDLGRAMCWR